LQGILNYHYGAASAKMLSARQERVGVKVVKTGYR
jgi:hypothetical protein